MDPTKMAPLTIRMKQFLSEIVVISIRNYHNFYRKQLHSMQFPDDSDPPSHFSIHRLRLVLGFKSLDFHTTIELECKVMGCARIFSECLLGDILKFGKIIRYIYRWTLFLQVTQFHSNPENSAHSIKRSGITRRIGMKERVAIFLKLS